MKQFLMTGAVVLAMSAAPAFAQGQTTPGAAAKDTMKSAKAGAMSADHKFVHEAAIGGMAEVELGKLAEQNASSDQVKSFGKRMVDDHGKANDELKTLAKNKNITLPSDLDAKHKTLVDRLSKLHGAEFDKAYMHEMLQDHRKDVNEFRHESTAGADSDVKSFAAKTLPTLEEHLKLAEDANKAVGTSGTKSSSKTKGQ
jgi:putative membrane protein